MNLALDLTERYTYADYLTWWDDTRRELIDGFIKLMSPAATASHATVVMNTSNYIFNYINKMQGQCRVFVAPFDVRLPKNGEKDDKQIYTVVQPDICVICDPSKIDDRGCLGAPDMVVEILSRSTRRYDLTEKFSLYEASGVKEYWVIEPKAKDVTVFLLQDDGKYGQGIGYEGNGIIQVQTLPGLEINTQALFKSIVSD